MIHESECRICVTVGAAPYVHPQASMAVPKCVKAGAFDPKFVQDRPETESDKFVCGAWAAVAIEK
jgi:hypothetical protein